MTGAPLPPPPPRSLLDPQGNISNHFYQWLGKLQGAAASTVNMLATISEALAADYWSNATGFKALTPETVWSSTGYVSLTDGTTISVDMSTGFNFSVSIAGNRTLSNPSNAKTGQSGCFKVTASGADRTLTLDSNFKATSDIIEPVAIASGQIAYVFYWVDTSSRIIVTAVAINPT